MFSLFFVCSTLGFGVVRGGECDGEMEFAPLTYFGAGDAGIRTKTGVYFAGVVGVVLEDFDGDGDVDAFVSGTKIIYYENDGSKYIARGDVNPFQDAVLSSRTHRLSFIDVDLDGDKDVFVVRNIISSFLVDPVPLDDIVLLENIDGKFVLNEELNPFVNQTFQASLNILTFDSDGDGKKDEIFIGNIIAYRCFKVFGEGQIVEVVGDGNFLSGLVTKEIQELSSNFIQMFDLEGTGERQVFLGSVLLERLNSGEFKKSENQLFSYDNSISIAFGDLKNENRMDAVIFNDYLTYHERKDDGSYEPKFPALNPIFESIPFEDLEYPNRITFFDFNKDGEDDLFITKSDGIVYFPFVNGTFLKALEEDQPFSTITLDFNVYQMEGKVQFMDIGGTFHALVQYVSVSQQTNDVRLLQNVNNKFYHTNYLDNGYAKNLATIYDRVYVADIDGDEKLDFVYLNIAQTSSIDRIPTYEFEVNQTNPSFGNPLSDLSLKGINSIAFYDLDGDGQSDMYYIGRNELGVYSQNENNKYTHNAAENNPFYGLSKRIKDLVVFQDGDGYEFIANNGAGTVFTRKLTKRCTKTSSPTVSSTNSSSSPTTSSSSPTTSTPTGSGTSPVTTKRPTSTPTLSPTVSPEEKLTDAPSTKSNNFSPKMACSLLMSMFLLIQFI